MKVSILGTKYEVVFATLAENEKYINCDGYCDFYNKKIHVRKHTHDDSDYEADTSIDDDAMRGYENKVIRHELTHAFMFESGLDVNSHNIEQWARDEEMIDWMAIQMPKIMKAYECVLNAEKPKKTMVDVSYIDGHTETIELDDIDSYE